MMKAPQWRTLGLHAGTAVGAATAMLLFTASHSVDLYAVVDQVNVVAREVGKLITIVGPLITAGIGVWKASTPQKIADIAKDPDVKGIITTPALADVPIAKVQASVAALPVEAKAAR